MRVGVLVDRHEPSRGGMERALSALIAHLQVAGDEVHVYGLAAASDAPGTFHAVTVPRLPRGERERALAERSLAAARRDRCDVTAAVRHTPEVDVLWPHGGAHGATLAAGERAKGGVRGTVSRMLHRASPRHRVFLGLEHAALSGGARRVWCVSELVRRELTAAHPGCEARLEVHANGVDRSRFHPGLREAHRDEIRARWGVAEGTPLLVFPGGNLALKGWPLLLDALERCVDSPWTCVAVGVDVARAVRALRGRDVPGRVLALPDQDMTAVLGAADLLVQPTFRDPCSLATLEALAAGVPVVTTDANGAAEIVDERCGAVVPAGDADALSVALTAWTARGSDPSSRSAAAVAARQATLGRDAETWLQGLRDSLAALA